MNMKEKVIKFTIIALLLANIMSLYAKANELTNHLYALTTCVVTVDQITDTVTVEDSNGNLWDFFGCEDWTVGDICSMVMDDNGTTEIYDDIIINTRYNGRENVMDKKEIARILYNMSLDMDYADSLEFAENEIDCIAGELNMVKEINCDSLFQVLEHIAMQNKDMEHWKDKIQRRN